MLLLGLWRAKINKTYDCEKWQSWCSQREHDPFSGPIRNVVNFPVYLYKDGYQYSSINAYRSLISSVHQKVDDFSVGQHPLITRLIKGIFHARPPLPHYTTTWNVQLVLNYIEPQGDNQNISLKLLSFKLPMLLALHIRQTYHELSISQYVLTSLMESAFTLSLHQNNPFADCNLLLPIFT